MRQTQRERYKRDKDKINAKEEKGKTGESEQLLINPK